MGLWAWRSARQLAATRCGGDFRGRLREFRVLAKTYLGSGQYRKKNTGKRKREIQDSGEPTQGMSWPLVGTTLRESSGKKYIISLKWWVIPPLSSTASGGLALFRVNCPTVLRDDPLARYWCCPTVVLGFFPGGHFMTRGTLIFLPGALLLLWRSVSHPGWF